MDLTEKTVQKHYVYEGKIISVRCDEALRPDGKPCKRELIEHPGGACVLYVEDGRMLLVKQFRYAYGEMLYEIPAGKLEAGEDPALAAARELSEEAGVEAENLELLFVMYPTPGYTNEKIYIYRASGGRRADAHPDEGEFVQAEFVPLETVKKMLEEGTINDAKTIVAAQAYFLSQQEK